MTKEEAEQIRKRALEVSEQNRKQDLMDKESRYNEWLTKFIESLEKRMREEAELGHTEFEITTPRARIPEAAEEHWYEVPYSVPRCGTGAIMDYLAKLGFKCDFRPGRWCSDVITIHLI